jgi:hypothetical protein
MFDKLFNLITILLETDKKISEVCLKTNENIASLKQELIGLQNQVDFLKKEQEEIKLLIKEIQK